ncbi:MAG: indole-3-glycerol phosphate synthase TrpC [Phenylobacterium sp.]
MSDILDRIAAYKREDVAQRKIVRPLAELESAAREVSEPRGFRAALERAHRPGRLALIAEIKKASPSKGLIRADFDPSALAHAYEDGGATCLSVLTDTPSFQGADDHLVVARMAVGLPCLRKEFLVDPWQVTESRALGADAVLVILAMVDDSLASDLMEAARTHGMDVLVETHDEAELMRAVALKADLIGINNRDLRTFDVDLAVTERLAAAAPGSALLVTESGVATPADAERLERSGAKAMLVGESLMRQPDVEAATRILLAG